MVVLIWGLRFLIYGGLAILSLGVIAPAIGGGIGIFAAAPLAALAVALDVFLTAKMRKTTVVNIASSRMLMIDSVLSKNGSDAENSTLEIEGEVVETHRLEEDPGKD